MPSLRDREQELGHAATVCGWVDPPPAGTVVHLSAEAQDWTTTAHRGSRSRIGPSVLRTVALLYDPSHDLFGLLSDYVRNVRAHPAHPESEARTAVSAFAALVSGIEGVEGVFFVEAVEEIRVWTVMNEPDRDVEDRVYAAEAETLDGNPQLLLDFRILFRHGKPIQQLRPAAARNVG